MNTQNRKPPVILATIFLCFLLSSNLVAQTFLQTLWEKEYDVNPTDRIYSSFMADDGSCILVGETSPAAAQTTKILVVKITKEGDLVWQKTLGSNGDFKYISVVKSRNEGFYILAINQASISKKFIWVSKADANGNILWESSTPAGEMDKVTDIAETPDNGVFVCGSKEIKGDHDTDAWLIKFTKRGAIESQALFGTRYINDDFNSVVSDNSGGYILSGSTAIKMGDNQIPYFVNVDFRGNKKWEKSFPDLSGIIPSSAFINSNGYFVCLGRKFSDSESVEQISKIVLNLSGEMINNLSIRRDLNVSKNSYIQLDNNQLLMVSSKQEQSKTLSDKYLIKLDDSLMPVWIKSIDIENVSIESLLSLGNNRFLSTGSISAGSKMNGEAILFQDLSDSELEKIINKKLILAGMTPEEDRNSFRTRIGRAKFDGYIAQYTSDAVKDLGLIPESFTRDVSSSSDSRPSILVSDRKDPESSGGVLLKGNYYALLIAINDYKDPLINNLDKPISDAQKLFDVLVSDYLFEKNNITFLKNPTREQIISALDKLEKEITKADNLLIFYAGHGYWNDVTQKGYWLASDASKLNTANWIGNSSISDYIRSIPAKHTLLIADACFSGSIFKSRAAFGGLDKSAQKLYDLTSRKAMTSGTLTEVPDKSVFIEYLVKRLSDNSESYLSSEQLFFSFKPAVLNNTENIPQFGVVGNAGDEGGDFIFIKRGK